MKKVSVIFPIILLAISGCIGNKQSTDGFITVDVTANYPKKELILQDFMDVEYVPLETSDAFLTQGFVLCIGKDIVVAKNHVNDGDIFFFDRTGRGIKKINRKGQGGEEYTFVLGVTLDEERREMFVNDHSTLRILVYDLDGNFKRAFKHKQGAMYSSVYNFDLDNLLCYDDFIDNNAEGNRQTFLIVSKQDGSITKEIQIPVDKQVLLPIIMKDEVNNMTWAAAPRSHYPIIPYLDNYIIVKPSADTVYSYSPENTMTPFIVRTPPVQSMSPEVFLLLSILTDRYYFMETVKREYDFETDNGFPATDLIYDNQEKAIFRYTVYNGDYSDKRTVYMKTRPMNSEIATCQALQSDQLVEDYSNGKLKGRLKEIAAGLNEESNPVIMLIKHKQQ
ncbi:MAG: 6-bladed beta-propeller [Tannerellaceae bacterium]|jgi:hypothetical protein|nr:6-bladed beta-propeller [Tannerellaceae bacterium]